MTLPLLTFNQLLDKAGIPAAQTRLARHQSKRGPTGKSPADLWNAGDGAFEVYQSYQSDDVFGDATYVASFVPMPGVGTLFLSLYRIVRKGMAEDATVMCPVNGHSLIDHHWYMMERLDVLDAYRERLIIEWGGAYQRWVQYAHQQDKPILEIRKMAAEVAYPGHIHFVSTIAALEEVPSTWKSNLQNACGVYLLVSLKTGQHYVGSANGAGGFWQRWTDYAADGHGGNELMKLTADGDYQVSILEVAASSATEQDIRRLEALWMKKLRSTAIGLNNLPGKSRARKG
ncbi:GIY-YIG nuclease family protein [Dyella sp. C9]|uniref:GIY-YIG nuclease family protein n=1 Tax=Dyella sp. C9 TaxID=2202154 RepID=UPI000DEFF9AE|nr:GIY-YIG nuclease family protein [Dyella sp. C9]